MDGSPLPFPAPESRRRRTGILVAGILLVLAPFLFVNPIELPGDPPSPLSSTRVVAWPWERFAPDPLAQTATPGHEPTPARWRAPPLAHVVEVSALFVLGVAAVLAGLGLGGRRLLLVLATGGVFYAIRLHGVDDAYRLAAVETFGLSGYATTLALLVGGLLMRSESAAARALGRKAAVAGALLGAVLVVGCFSTNPPIPDVNVVEEFVRRLPKRLDAVLGTGSMPPSERFQLLDAEICGKALPEVLYALASVLALVAAAAGRAGAAGRGRRAALGVVVAVLLAWLSPWAGNLFTGIREATVHHAGSPWQAPVAASARTIMEDGFGLLLLIAFAGARVVEGLAERGATGTPTVGDGARFRRGAFAAALVLAALTLWVAFRPDVGLFARERAWTILGRGVRWDRSMAALVAVVGSLLVATVGLVRARPGSGFGVLTGALAAAFVAEHALRMLSRSPTMSYVGVTAYVPFGLAAVAAGLAGSPSKGARTASRVAAVLLLAIFAEPRVVLDPVAPSAIEGGPYSSYWTIGAMESRTLGDYLFGSVPDYGCPAVVAWLTLVALVALVGRGARAANVTRALLVVSMLWLLGQVAFVTPPPTRFDSSTFGSPNGLERAAALAVFAFVGFALSVAAGVSRRGAAGGAGT